MRRMMAHVGGGLALLIPFAVGCNLVPGLRDKVNVPPATATAQKPTVESLVAYLNQEALKVQNIRAKVDIDAKGGGQAVGLSGLLAAQKPRQFRLMADVLGKSACDIGSNNDEFWYWISADRPPRLNYCSYRDLSAGKVRIPFPFQPDMVLAALGIADYDAAAKYELREQPRTWELVQATTTAAGEQVTRITVFNREIAAPGRPQVLGHVLQDARGKLICKAVVEKVAQDRGSNAKIPSVVKIDWPGADMSMKLMLSGIETNKLDVVTTGRLFSRAGLRYEAFDLAQASPTGLQQTGAVLPRRR